MKLKEKVVSAEIGGNFETIDLKIKASGKAFRILSSNLYANKIQAIIRELSCNARDSHVEAGRPDTPFEVTLPTQLDPTFRIRDYGTGLDHDGVTNVWSVYFESTKQDSNDGVGCMGLGSKTPFSYTDSFTVMAIKDGVKRSYTVFTTDAGTPAIAKMLEEPTEEPSGVEVSFAVTDREDQRMFAYEAATVLPWFDTVPVVNNLPKPPERPPVEEKFTKTLPANVTVYSAGTTGYARSNIFRSTISVKMGPVIYPVNIQTLIDASRETEYADGIDFWARMGTYDGVAVFDVPMGEVEFVPSREELSYTSETVSYLLKILTDAHAFVYRDVEEKFRNLPTPAERQKFVREGLGRSGYGTTLYSVIVLSVAKKNTNLLPRLCDVVQVTGNAHHDRYMTGETRLDDAATKVLLNNNVAVHGLTLACRTVQQMGTYSTWKRPIVVLMDNCAAASKKMAAMIQPGGDFRSVMVLRLSNPYDGDGKRIKQQEVKKILTEVFNKCGLAESEYERMVYTSDLPRPEGTKKQAKKTATYFMIGKADSGWYGRRARQLRWDELLHSPPDPIKYNGKEYWVYVPLVGRKIDLGPMSVSLADLANVIQHGGTAEMANLKYSNLIGLRKTEFKYREKRKGVTWISLPEYLKMVADNIDETMMVGNQIFNTMNDIAKHLSQSEKAASLAEQYPTSPLGQFVIYTRSANVRCATNMQNFFSSMNTLGIKDGVDRCEAATEKAKRVVRAVAAAYPMLSLINDTRLSYHARDVETKLCDYIELVEKSR